MSKLTAEQIALLCMDTIIQMSDHAESLGGATSIAGVAALHKMQQSIQKNKQRILAALKSETGKGTNHE
jgi:hypothetical protein